MHENLHNCQQSFNSQEKKQQQQQQTGEKKKRKKKSRSNCYEIIVEGKIEMSNNQYGFVKKKSLCYTNRISFL